MPDKEQHSQRDNIAINSKIIRGINRANVLRTIMERGPISRIEVARLNGLTQSTVSRIVDKLLAEKLVYEQSKGESALGRKPINLVIAESSRIIGIIAITVSSTVVALCDLGGKELELERFATVDSEPEAFLKKCATTLEKMINSYDQELVGVGVTLPGQIDMQTGILEDGSALGWERTAVHQAVSGVIRAKVLVENSAKAAAQAELCFEGEAKNFGSFFYVQLGECIETALVIDRILYHGYRGLDGRFGRIAVPGDGSESAQQAENGCWDDYASSRALIDFFCQAGGELKGATQQEKINRIVDAARSGEEAAVEAFRRQARALGAGLSQIVNGLFPQGIIIDGGITRLWESVLPSIMEGLRQGCTLPEDYLDTLVVPSTMSFSAFEGALAIVLQDFFGGYFISHRQFNQRPWAE